MIKSLLIFIMLLLPFNLMAQNDDTVFQKADVYAHFIGGPIECLKYIKENMIYPQKSMDEKIEGDVKLSFIVEKDGSLTHFTIKESVCEELDAEAIRIFHQMPKWICGKINDKDIRQEITFTVSFKLKK